MATFAKNCSVKMTLRLFKSRSVFMTMVPRILRKFRRSLRIKKMLLMRYNLLNSQNIATYQSINNEKWLVNTGIPPTQIKKLLKLCRKKSNSWSIVSFIHNGSEITTQMGHSFKTKTTTCNIQSKCFTIAFLR